MDSGEYSSKLSWSFPFNSLMTTLDVFLLLLITPWLPLCPIEESAHLQGRRQYKDTKNLLLLLLNRLPPEITDGQGLVKNNFMILQFYIQGITVIGEMIGMNAFTIQKRKNWRVELVE